MRKLYESETREIEGGYHTYCPICGKKVSVFFLKVWFLGKGAAYAEARAQASANHYSYRTGFKSNVKHY